ncbi:MAG: hypothetical protein Q7R63_02060, partial [bacterium]|nr:hypothetical protein [bacterium]
MKEWPKINEVFELVLDASAPENDPIEMVHGDGYRIDGWQHTGKKLDGRCSAHFKLIQFSSRIFYYFN